MGNPWAELGVTGDDGKLTVEHALLLSGSAAMESTFRETLAVIAKSSRETSKSIKIVGYAAAIYLVMSGVAKIIESYKKSDSDDIESKKKR